MNREQAVGGPDVATTLYAVGCFVTIASLTFAEQAAQLPAAAVACLSGWFVVRAGTRPTE